MSTRDSILSHTRNYNTQDIDLVKEKLMNVQIGLSPYRYLLMQSEENDLKALGLVLDEKIKILVDAYDLLEKIADHQRIK